MAQLGRLCQLAGSGGLARVVALSASAPAAHHQASPILEAPQSMINYSQAAGYKRRNSNKVLHTPTFDEYHQLPGDDYQTVYYGFYDDGRHCEPRAFDRFYRLNWGGWIRARGGRTTGSWRKTGQKMWWSKQHILCSERQCSQLEQMFTKKYRQKTYFVDDPYEIYEKREKEFLPVGHAVRNYSYLKSPDFDG